MTVRVDERLVAEDHAVGAARRALGDVDATLDSTTRETLAVVVSELVANAVRHGSTRATDPVGVRVLTTARGVRVEVTDRGEEFARPRRPVVGELQVGGWGLHIVEELTSRWGIDQHRTAKTVWCELDLQPKRG